MLCFVRKFDGSITYDERKLKKMATSSNQENNNQTVLNRTGRNTIGTVGQIISIILTIFSILSVIVGVTIYVVSNITGLKKDIDYLKIEVAKVGDINGQVEELMDLINKDHETFLELSSASVEKDPYEVTFNDAYQIETKYVENEEYLAEPAWNKGSVIASDIKGDIIYKDEDLYNEPIITSYLDGNNEVFFYGRFNENNQWNGKCVLNVYSGDNLVSIFEGVYDNGTLFSYKRVSVEVSKEGKDIWLVNDRVIQVNYNSGETWTYEKKEDFVKGFSTSDVKEKQVLTVDRFLDSKDLRMLSYYKGNTSKGLYNDDGTYGNPYLVKYKEDGDVEYLYVGKMKDGYPHDTSGEAWSVGWGYEEDGYYYYKGKFYNGKHGETPKNWKPMTEEEIRQIIDFNNFRCLLTGLAENDF